MQVLGYLNFDPLVLGYRQLGSVQTFLGCATQMTTAQLLCHRDLRAITSRQGVRLIEKKPARWQELMYKGCLLVPCRGHLAKFWATLRLQRLAFKVLLQFCDLSNCVWLQAQACRLDHG